MPGGQTCKQRLRLWGKSAIMFGAFGNESDAANKHDFNRKEIQR